MKATLRLEEGTRLEFWATGPGFIRISVGGMLVWQVPAFTEDPGFYRYHHREAGDVTVELDNAEAILWAYSYLPDEVLETGITVWDFGTEGITRRTGEEIDSWMRSDPDRPRLHFSPIRQWMNDPNGLCKVGDTWQMFYQFHPAGTDWGPMHWGHATSTDLFSWTHLPVFLHPEQNLWRLGATGGAFSGNAFRDRNGTLRFFYTERLPAYDLFIGYREIQKMAEPGRDMITPERISVVLEDRPEGVEHDFRDPKVWWDEASQSYRMVLGASIDGDPAVLLYGSRDLFGWAYLGPLYRAPVRFRDEGARAVECPDFFPLDGKWVLIMGFVGHTEPETGRHNLLYALVGEFVDDQFVPDTGNLQPLDFGTDFYAMQSFEADGRQIAFAWLFNWEDRKPHESYYSGEMSLPRQLCLSDDKMQLKMRHHGSFREVLERIRIAAVRDGTYLLSDVPFEITIAGPLEGTDISAKQGDQLAFRLTVSDGIAELRLAQDDGSIRYAANVTGLNDMLLVFDRGIVEVFIGDGIVCGTRRSYMAAHPDQLHITTCGQAAVSSLRERVRSSDL